MDKIYFEKQEQRLCGLHTLNMLLQSKSFTGWELDSVARELDDKEHGVLTEPTANAESDNYDSTGYYSIQVISTALRKKGFDVINIDHPDAVAIKKDPTKAEAFICHMSDHWFAIRKIGPQWFELNSLRDGPSYLSDLHITAYIATLIHKGYAVFVVNGFFPPCAASEALTKQPYIPKDEKGFPVKGGQRLGGSPPLVPQPIPLPAPNAPANGEWPGVGHWGTPPAYDDELERAIQLSLQEQAGTSSGITASTARQPTPTDDDEELQRAIAMSLQDTFVDEDERQFQLALQMSLVKEETPEETMRRKREEWLNRVAKQSEK